MTRTTAKKTTTAPAPAVKKTTTKRAPAKPRTPRARTRKTTGPALSLVKTRPALPTRDKPFMTDVQGYATLAARIASITTPRITQWTDHGDDTATRPLKDGTLHYDHTTRTLSWQATCLMGAIHTYPIPTPAAATAARVLAARCTQPHADPSTVPPLTADELEALGLLQTPTWARPDLLGDHITETIPVPEEPLARATASATDTQPLSRDDINAGLAARAAQHAADTDQTKEHPEP
ncbi:hypothetical protein [Streptomyces sp. NPDC001658]